jgi:hypothetical protein
LPSGGIICVPITPVEITAVPFGRRGASGRLAPL